jgi:Sec-independent protein secretion pathway component TatC
MVRLSPRDVDIPMNFSEHLGDLRRRLILVLIGVGITSTVTLAFGWQVVAWLCAPLLDALRAAGQPARLYTFSPGEGFSIYITVGTVAGVVLALPWVLYQAWQFIAVGLYSSERRVFSLLAPFSAVMTVLGVLFFYYVMLPISLWFLINFSANFPAAPYRPPSAFFSRFWGSGVPEVQSDGTGAGRESLRGEGVTTQPSSGGGAVEKPTIVPSVPADPIAPTQGQLWFNTTERELKVSIEGRVRTVQLTSPSLISPVVQLSSYMRFVAFTSLGVVAAFQLPVLMQVLGWTGLIDPEFFAQYRRHCIFVCFALGMMLTPPDVMSMMILSFPLWGLFELGLFVMRRAYRSHGQSVEEWG